MKSCDYCGKENEDVLEFCAGCGTDLTHPVTESLAPSGPRVLNARFATIIFVIVLAAQYIGITLVAIFGAFIELARNPGAPSNATAIVHAIMPFAIIVGSLCGGIALVWTTTALGFRRNDTSPTGAAWVRGSWRDIGGGLITGVLVVLVTGPIFFTFRLSQPHHGMDYLTRMRMTPGFPQIAWATSLLLFAPLIEELLFRGVFYGGYRRSFGPTWAAVVTTSIFVLTHLPYLVYQPIGTINIAGLALAALWWRLRSGAVGPAIALHFGYNASLTLLSVILQS